MKELKNMLKWLFMVGPLYLTYYTLMFAFMVWKKEKNMLAFIFITLLALSITAVPIWHRLR